MNMKAKHWLRLKHYQQMQLLRRVSNDQFINRQRKGLAKMVSHKTNPDCLHDTTS